MSALSAQAECDITHSYFLMQQAFQETQYRLQAPHAVMRPKVYPDGDRWCALYGKDIQSGVAGFGKTPEGACANFDHNWQQQTISKEATP